MKFLKLFAAMALVSTSAMAQVVEMGTPSYGGSGCTEGSVATTLSPDNTSLSIIFDSYLAEAGGGKRAKTSDRKSCDMQIPVTAPAGYKIRFLLVDFRGFAEIGKDGDGTFTAEHQFMTNGRVPAVKTSQTFKQGHSGEFLLTHALNYFVSPCGGSFKMAFNTSLVLNARKNVGRSWQPATETSLMGLDSSDMSNDPAVFVKFGLEKCD